MNATKKRLLALEQKRTAGTSQNIARIPQIVPYDASTGLPHVPPDPTVKQIWIPDNERDFQSLR